MNPILKNVLAVVVGWLIGSAANFGIVMLGHQLVALPEGVDPMDSASIAEHADAFTSSHYIFPFLAHAIGTLLGAFIAAKIATEVFSRTGALIVGVLFLLGGIMAAYMLPAPMWFVVLDLVVAYIPMALLGWMLAGSRN